MNIMKWVCHPYEHMNKKMNIGSYSVHYVNSQHIKEHAYKPFTTEKINDQLPHKETRLNCRKFDFKSATTGAVNYHFGKNHLGEAKL